MRTETLYTGGKVNYPDRWCYAFNKHYVDVHGTNVAGPVTVTISDTSKPFGAKKLQCFAVNGSFKIEIGEAMRAMLDNPLTERCKYLHVSVGSRLEEIISFHIYIVWGCITDTDGFLKHCDFSIEDGELYLNRHVVWFTEYPFTLSLFKRSVPLDIIDKNPGALDLDDTEESTLEYQHTISELAVFDNSFDMTFKERFDDKLTERIKITPCGREKGAYLRWIDQYGYTQYYLFDKGDATLKSTSSETKVEDLNYKGYLLKRPIHVGVEKTLKCCADNLADDILKTVEGISSALCVDMYCNNKWLPVKVEVNTNEANKEHRRDFEISVTFQTITQNLL